MTAILIIEDDENDVLLLRMALAREGITNPIHIVHNGKEAIRYLENDGEYADRFKYPFPDLIFTDLKMPVMGGFAVLEWLKKHPDLCVIPIVVLSSSADGDDIRKAYRLGASAYMVKPGSLDELRKAVRRAHEFWKHCEKPALKE